MSLMNGLPIEGSGNNFADREYARFMHAFKTPYVSAPLVGRITNTPLVLMLVPFMMTRVVTQAFRWLGRSKGKSSVQRL